LSFQSYSSDFYQPGYCCDQDKLTRISFLVGIFVALDALHGRRLADLWVNLPNSNPLFGGRTPLQFMSAGGLSAFSVVRRLLDARVEGA